MYFALQKHYPTKEQYGDTLHFCRHCSILFWKVRRASVLLERETVPLSVECDNMMVSHQGLSTRV